MSLLSRSLQFIGAAAPNRTFKAAMSSSSFNARGRNHWRRGFCDRTLARGYQGLSEVDAFVSGDSHVSDVRSANYGQRQGYTQQQFRPWRPSPPPFRSGPPPKSADHRNWIFAASQPTPDRERFKVLSYNILADYLALDHQAILYFHLPNHILAWEWRKRRLFIEFGLWSPDIMCLQEVDQFCDLEGELAIRGYTGIWKMRTGNAVDGCAIFWRTNRFQLRHEEHIEFSKLGLRDNVAQICVLESKMRFPEDAALPSSYNLSSGANQVIVCNTHVLYNPKRGEIKLGQVRILLDRAFSISRAWNDAPVIVCGDFNSTPTSPLYKFIASQKLNLLGLARDQISGQYSATLHNRLNSRYNSYRPQSFSHNMGNASSIKKSPEQMAHELMRNGTTTIKLGEAEIFRHQGGEISSVHFNRDADNSKEEAPKNTLDDPCSEDYKVSQGSGNLTDEIKLTSTSCMDHSTVSPSHNTVNFHNFQIDLNNGGNAPSFHSNRDDVSTMVSCEADETLLEEKPCTSFASLEVQTVENTENFSTGSAVTAQADSFITCHNSGKGNGLDVYNFDGSHVSDKMDVISCVVDEKIMNVMNSVEDSKKVASDKIPEEIPSPCGNLSRDATSTENSQSPEVFGLEENVDPNFFKELLGMEDDNQTVKEANAPNLGLLEGSSFPLASAASNVERSFYNPYCWSPMETEIASGKANCTIVEHPWKLRSVYTDVEDYTGTKDSSREPQVTSYNQQFMGTVDYIWCSEDLQTVKVLDTIPKHVLQRTPGFPTHKWGSDHIALVCELAFSKGCQNK